MKDGTDFVLEMMITGSKRQFVTNQDRVEQWQVYLHKPHRIKKTIGVWRTQDLQQNTRANWHRWILQLMASVDAGEDDASTEFGLIRPALASRNFKLVDHHTLAFDRFLSLYLQKQEFCRIRQSSETEIITDY